MCVIKPSDALVIVEGLRVGVGVATVGGKVSVTVIDCVGSIESTNVVVYDD